MGRIEAAILPPVDQARQGARRPALVVDVLRLQDLLDETDLVVGVEDGEIRLEAHQFGVTAQDLGADRMERAHPGHALDDAGQEADALAHFARRLVGEGHRQNLVRPGAARSDEMGDARGQDAGLADPGSGEHEHRPVERFDRVALFFVQALEVTRRDARPRPRRKAPRVTGGTRLGRNRINRNGQRSGSLAAHDESCVGALRGATEIGFSRRAAGQFQPLI